MSRHIGIIDDDPSILRALQRLLGVAGFRVTTFASGEEVLAYDRLDTLDCLVLDIHLVGVTGFDVQECLAARQPSLPIVFITAHDDPVTRKRAERTGPYLRKPFDEASLVQAIDAALAAS